MRRAAQEQQMPILTHLLRPVIRASFWVNLIGKGYPAPRHKFRWCTERLKIKPTNAFIQDVVSEHGEVILLLGVRRAESSTRASSIDRRTERSRRAGLTAHVHLANCLVYAPIKDWSNDDVWVFLMRRRNPWGHGNKDLLAMYRGASEDNECPLVVDTSTPSCGSSRFGCWVCTLVDQDKSMAAMIQNDTEKEWMLPLLELRNELDFRSGEARARDRERRDFRRLSGHLTHYTDQDGNVQLVPGPYSQRSRENWLRRLLRVQRLLRDRTDCPGYVRDIELIGMDELQEIRRVWVTEKHEIEDLVPRIYEQEIGEVYSGAPIDEDLVFGDKALAVLHELCQHNELRYEMARNLLDIERRFRTMGSRRGLFGELEKAVKRSFYDDKEDARTRVRQRARVKQLRFVSMDGEEVNREGAE